MQKLVGGVSRLSDLKFTSVLNRNQLAILEEELYRFVFHHMDLTYTGSAQIDKNAYILKQIENGKPKEEALKSYKELFSRSTMERAFNDFNRNLPPEHRLSIDALKRRIKEIPEFKTDGYEAKRVTQKYLYDTAPGVSPDSHFKHLVSEIAFHLGYQILSNTTFIFSNSDKRYTVDSIIVNSYNNRIILIEFDEDFTFHSDKTNSNYMRKWDEYNILLLDPTKCKMVPTILRIAYGSSKQSYFDSVYGYRINHMSPEKADNPNAIYSNTFNSYIDSVTKWIIISIYSNPIFQRKLILAKYSELNDKSFEICVVDSELKLGKTGIEYFNSTPGNKRIIVTPKTIHTYEQLDEALRAVA